MAEPADPAPCLLAPPLLVLALMGLVLILTGRGVELGPWVASAALLAGLTLLAFLPLAAIGARGERERWIAIALVALVYALNLFVLTLPRFGPFAGLDWNWQGKTLDLVWMLGVIALLAPAQRRAIGWTWQVRPGTLAIAAVNIAILALAGFLLAGVAPGRMAGGLSLERVLFDLSHANLVEEIAFRGFMLALLDRVFARHWAFGGARIGWGVVLTAWLFGLVHGITFTDGVLGFDPVWLSFAFVMGLVLGWIRTLTGSLWPAFLAHTAPEAGMLAALALP